MEQRTGFHRSDFVLGDWTVTPTTGTISRGKEVVHLEPRVMGILLELAERGGELVTKRQLLESAWPDAAVEASSLTRCISDLRKALSDNPQEPRYIRTVHRRGYELIVRPTAPQVDGDYNKRTCHMKMLVLSLVGAVFAAAGVAALHLISTPASPQSSNPVIAVVPLESLSDAAGSDAFAEGFAEELTTQLSRVRSLRVASPEVARSLQESGNGVGSAGPELGVDAVVQGSVRKDGGRVRVCCQIIDSRTQQIIWAEVFDRRGRGDLRLQVDLARRIAGACETRLTGQGSGTLNPSPTRDIAAYDLYLKGQDAYSRYRRDENENAIAFFKGALEADPSFALAHAGLANAYALRSSMYDYDSSSAELALQAGARAMELDPEHPESLKAMATACDAIGSYRQAIELYLGAVERRSDFAAAVNNLAVDYFRTGNLVEAIRWQSELVKATHTTTSWAVLASFLGEAGMMSEAEAALKIAAAARPNDSRALMTRAYLQTITGDRDGARQTADHLLRLNPNDRVVLLLLGELEHLNGRSERAYDLLSKGIGLAGDSDSKGRLRCRQRLAALKRARGRHRGADVEIRTVAAEARAGLASGSEEPGLRWISAALEADRGEHEQALLWYREALALGHRKIGWDLRDPLLEGLRGDVRFRRELETCQRLVERMRFEIERSDWFGDLAKAATQ